MISASTFKWSTAAVFIAVVACDRLPAASRPATTFYLTFSGDGQYVEIPSAPDLGFGPDGLTVSAWIKPDTLEFSRKEGSGYVYWMGKGDDRRHEWAGRIYSYTNEERPPRPNRISFYLFNLEGGYGAGSYFQEPVHEREWIHVTGAAGGGDTAIYHDGEYVRCDEYNGPSGHGCTANGYRIHPMPGSAPLRIGTRDLVGFFQGGITQVRIWNRPLTADEIRRLYRSNEVPRNGLTAEFLLDEGKGDVVHDTTGRHEGKIVGAMWVRLQKSDARVTPRDGAGATRSTARTLVRERAPLVRQAAIR